MPLFPLNSCSFLVRIMSYRNVLGRAYEEANESTSKRRRNCMLQKNLHLLPDKRRTRSAKGETKPEIVVSRMQVKDPR